MLLKPPILLYFVMLPEQINRDFGSQRGCAAANKYLKNEEVALELGDDKTWNNFPVLTRKSQDCCEGTVGRNKDIEGHSGVVSDGSKEQFIENWTKDNPC